MLLLALACSTDVPTGSDRSRAKTDIACNTAEGESLDEALDAGHSRSIGVGGMAEFEPIPGATWDLIEAPMLEAELEIDPAGARLIGQEPGVYVVRASRGALRDKVTVVVEGIGSPPTALADDVEIALGETADLDASGSTDEDGDALNYSWGFNSAPSDSDISKADLDDSTSATTSFTPDAAGDYELRVTVDDGLYSDIRVVRVRVSGSSTPTTASDEDQLVESGAPVFVGIEADAADEVRFVFVDAPKGSTASFSTDGNCGSFTPDVAGVYEIKAVRDTGSTVYRKYPTVTVVDGVLDSYTSHSTTWREGFAASSDQLLANGGGYAIVVTDLPLADEPTWTTVLSSSTDRMGSGLTAGELSDGEIWQGWRGSDPILFHDSSDEQVFTGDVAELVGDVDGTGGVFLLDDTMYTGPSTALVELGTLEYAGPSSIPVVSARGAGDQDGDGVDDLLVWTEWSSSYGSGCTTRTGYLSLVQGPITGDVDLKTDFDGRVKTSGCMDLQRDHYLVGDLDDDGYGDLVYQEDWGELSWRPGKHSGISYTTYDLEAEGVSLYAPRIADIDDDGVQDLIVDTVNDGWIVYGPLTGDLDLFADAATVLVDGDNGYPVDLDDDGVIELLGQDSEGLWVFE